MELDECLIAIKKCERSQPWIDQSFRGIPDFGLTRHARSNGNAAIRLRNSSIRSDSIDLRLRTDDPRHRSHCCRDSAIAAAVRALMFSVNRRC